MNAIQPNEPGITLDLIKSQASQVPGRHSYFTKAGDDLNIYVLKGMDKVKLFFEKMLNILTFGLAFSSENSLLGRIRSAKEHLLKLPSKDVLEIAQTAISLGRINGTLPLVFDPFAKKVPTPELAVALLGYAVEQGLFRPKQHKLVISKCDGGYKLERLSIEDEKSTDLSNFNEVSLKAEGAAIQIRGAARKQIDKSFTTDTITCGIVYLFGEQAEEGASENNSSPEEFDPNILPTIEELSTPRSDQLSASSTRGNSPIGRNPADELSSAEDLEALKKALQAELKALRDNPITFAPVIKAAEQRLLDVLIKQVQQV